MFQKSVIELSVTLSLAGKLAKDEQWVCRVGKRHAGRHDGKDLQQCGLYLQFPTLDLLSTIA